MVNKRNSCNFRRCHYGVESSKICLRYMHISILLLESAADLWRSGLIVFAESFFICLDLVIP